MLTRKFRLYGWIIIYNWPLLGIMNRFENYCFVDMLQIIQNNNGRSCYLIVNSYYFLLINQNDLFLIYINDLPNNLTSTTKRFADNTSMFSIVHSAKKSCDDLNFDLTVINNWAYQWKMSFNPDPNKQAAEVIFPQKRVPVVEPSIYFNNSPV